MADQFEPKIVALTCNWCTYAGADLAGTSRKKYAPNVRLVRVMCSGRVDPAFVLRALQDGADGVLIAGCHPGDCHYINGNHKTLRRYHGYSIESNHNSTDTHTELTTGLTNNAEHALLATDVEGCSFTYTAGTSSRNALVTIRLEMAQSGESVVLHQQVQVPNTP